MQRLVENLDGRLHALRDALDAGDAAELRAIAAILAENAREEIDCGFIGLEQDDGLVEEMELSLITERAEELIHFCRLAMDEARERAAERGTGEDA